jgi:hypothetical protein
MLVFHAFRITSPLASNDPKLLATGVFDNRDSRGRRLPPGVWRVTDPTMDPGRAASKALLALWQPGETTGRGMPSVEYGHHCW